MLVTSSHHSNRRLWADQTVWPSRTNGLGFMPINTSEPCYGQGSANRSQNWPLASVLIRN